MDADRKKEIAQLHGLLLKSDAPLHSKTINLFGWKTIHLMWKIADEGDVWETNIVGKFVERKFFSFTKVYKIEDGVDELTHINQLCIGRLNLNWGFI